MESGEGKELLARAAAGSAFWSEINRSWLEAVGRDPSLGRLETFASIHRDNPYRKWSLQSWPFFISPERQAEMARIAVGLDRLVKSVPERFFARDVDALAEFYGVADRDLVALVLTEPDGIAPALSRGDYLDTEEGFFCIELNAGSAVGGWQMQRLESLYRAVPAIESFLADHGVAGGHANILRRLFRQWIRDTIRGGFWSGGTMNVALILYPHDAAQVAVHPLDLYRQEYRAALAEVRPDLEGELLFCSYDQLEEREGRLWLGPSPVAAAHEQQNAPTDRRAFRAFKAGALNLLSGPVTRLLSDKRNLALLSEAAELGDLEAEARDLVETHIPWTRIVSHSHVTFEGRRAYLPALLDAERSRFVLKKAGSLGGMDVHLGPTTDAPSWQRRIETALAEGDWLAQRHLEPRPYLLLGEASGIEPQEAVWGLFVFGGELGGVLLRAQSKGRGGPINNALGASVVLPFDVLEPA